MPLSPAAKSLIEAGVSFAKNDGPGIIIAIKRHDWRTVAIEAVALELELASAAGVPFAGLALKLLPLGVYMADHPHNSGEGGIGLPPEGYGSIS